MFKSVKSLIFVCIFLLTVILPIPAGATSPEWSAPIQNDWPGSAERVRWLVQRLSPDPHVLYQFCRPGCFCHALPPTTSRPGIASTS